MEIDWEGFLTIRDMWVSELLTEYVLEEKDKITLRIYTVKFNRNIYDIDAFAKFVVASTKAYVLSPDYVKNAEAKGQDALAEALGYFGVVNPSKDGKYGELILYMLTESVLKTPLIALKMPGNNKDQQKGADGIFCGYYKGDIPAILIGESKTWADLNAAMYDALDSLYRFYDPKNAESIKYEFLVAKTYIKSRLSLSKEELDYMYSCLTPGTEEHNKLSKVHPVLIMYNDKELKEIIEEPQENSEAKFADIVKLKVSKHLSEIKAKQDNYEGLKDSFLDMFLIPLKDVDEFRQLLYKLIHNGNSWNPKAENK